MEPDLQTHTNPLRDLLSQCADGRAQGGQLVQDLVVLAQERISLLGRGIAPGELSHAMVEPETLGVECQRIGAQICQCVVDPLIALCGHSVTLTQCRSMVNGSPCRYSVQLPHMCSVLNAGWASRPMGRTRGSEDTDSKVGCAYSAGRLRAVIGLVVQAISACAAFVIAPPAQA